MTTDVRFSAGLEDVVATTSALCYLDGEQGVLAYGGYDIHDLAAQATFEEVCHLLWYGRLPRRAELGDLRTELARARALPESILRLLRSLPQVAPMDLLRTVTSALAHYEEDVADETEEANRLRAIRLTGRMAAVVAALGRLARGDGPIASDPALGHAADFLYMLTGERQDEVATRAFDVALVLHADHELNASTFAARVAAATLSDMSSAVVAAIGTLKGRLHGGANTDVMRLLHELGAEASRERVGQTIRAKLARKEKIPGFGHRVYRTGDPRATHLRRLSRELGTRAGRPHWHEMLVQIEALMTEEKRLYPNVDLYAASTYDALGIPLGLYTPVFAVSRVSGWTAHVLEQYANNRLLRPRAEYVGPGYPQRFVPLAER